MLPNFIIGGVMKSGTTFLHNLLINHPEIKIIERNMNHAYFDDDRIFQNGKDWYLGLFNNVKYLQDDFIIGQTSADCAFNPQSIDRILDHNPETKLIFVLRHPIDRAYSLYWHQYGMGREHRRFKDAIKKEPILIKKSYHHFKHYSYLERSRYKNQFKEIINIVPEKNLLLLDFISLTKNTKKSVNEVLKFLNVFEINDVEELNFSKLPRNPARIPTNHNIVRISAGLQKIKMFSIGRHLINLFRKDIKPPNMNNKIREYLEKELKEDILFYEQIQRQFQKRIK